MKNLLLLALSVVVLMSCNQQNTQKPSVTADPLPSWYEGQTKESIIRFVSSSVTAGPAFIEEADRVAVFDNDGTLWSEQPLYFQFAFVIDRVKALAGEHPEWKDAQPFKAVLEDDLETVMKSGIEGLLKLTMATHSGMTTEEFAEIVRDWIDEATHPQTGKRYRNMVYQPMLELLDYLRDNGFKTFIVSGGGVDFMRVFAEDVYGIPPYQVIGSSGKVRFEIRDNIPVIVKLPEIDFIDDKEGKPVGIHKYIGKKPVAAFGNSDGDLQMLQWTSGNDLNSLMVYIHHTDDEREWAYDRDSHIGKLDRGLNVALERGWTVVDMKNDWKVIWPESF